MTMQGTSSSNVLALALAGVRIGSKLPIVTPSAVRMLSLV
ncbi:hypothetical protein AGR7B_Lc150043 [Agrobacterium deltaense RV3]|nr:hypothetical protein AGR7B_Lc150043 [Agrobacterium deltaense RV3]